MPNASKTSWNGNLMSNLDNNDFTISTTNSNPPHIHEQVAKQ